MQEAKIMFKDTYTAFKFKSDTDLKWLRSLFSYMNNPFLVLIGSSMVQMAIKLNLPVKGLLKKTLFKQFCGGENIEDCDQTLLMLDKSGVKAILDYANEGEENEIEYDETTCEIIKTIEKAARDPRVPFSVFKPTGVASARLMAKIQNQEPLSQKEQQAINAARNRFKLIAAQASKNNVRLCIDSEESWYQNVVDEWVYELMAMFNKDAPIIFNTYQFYRKDMLQHLKMACAKARDEKYYLGVKLVRGAYMEKERERAEKNHYLDPIMQDKNATDNQYNDALRFCIENIDIIAICNGSHNEYSNYFLAGLIKQKKLALNDDRIWFAQLYGMSDHISFNLAKMGYNVVKYVPYGPIKRVLPYLIRRARENTSVKGQSSRELQLIKTEILRRKTEEA